MRAEKAIRSLLTGAAGVTALVGSRVYPGQLPQGTATPALVVSLIDTVDVPTIQRAVDPYGLVTSRVQVTAIAADYLGVKNLLEQARLACNLKSGTLAGVPVTSISRAGIGPDMRDDDLGLFVQSVDFFVTFREQ